MISDNITRDADGTLRFAGHSADELADTFGTPLYLMDEKRIRDNCRMYLAAFREHFGENSAVLYAAKACAFKAICRIAAEEGMGLDAVSVGEIHTALEAGFPADRIYFHGDAKTDDDIRYALDRNVGWLSAETKRRSVRQKVLLRVTPGIDPHTYEAVNTGTVDVKFGVPIENGQALGFVRRALDEESLDVAGLHCHVGSEVFDEDVFERTCDVMTAFMARLRRELGYTARELDLGGGYGVRYVESDPRADIPARIGEVASHLKRILGEAGLPMPRILMEPGRSIVADAGMTVHASRETGENEIFDLAGRCCESGDIIQPAVELPADTRRGDRVCVCTTGAYNYSMASNYNRLGRPPVVMLTGGTAWTAVRRETAEDLCALDL